MTPHTLTITDRNFVQEVFEAELPVLVDFWSFWCGACQHRRTAIDRIAAEYLGLVKVARIDLDDYTRVAAAYDVGVLPSLLLFHHGRVITRRDGVMSSRAIRQLLDDHLPPKAEWPLLRRAFL